jgi:hypothetical protein
MGPALKGQIGGSVRSIQAEHDNQLLCSASLDKWLRVHDVRTRKLLHKVYLRQPLTFCLWTRDSGGGDDENKLEDVRPSKLSLKRLRSIEAGLEKP